MATQLNIVLLLAGLLQGILLSILLIRKTTYRNAYIFLLIYVMVMLVQVLFKVMSKGWLMQNIERIYFLSYSFPYLYGPLVYLLTIHLLQHLPRFRAIHLLHFIPFIITLSPVHPRQLPFVIEAFINAYTSIWLQLASLLVYHTLAYRCWQQHSHRLSERSLDIRPLQFRWLRQFIVASGIICFIMAIAISALYIYYPAGNEFRFAFIGLTIFIYWVSYAAMQQPELFSVVRGQGEEASIPLIPRLVVHRPAKKYDRSSLQTGEARAIATALARLMQENRVFLDPLITIDILAKKLDCSRHHLSQVINDELQQSFYDYINGYRVEEAKRLLSDPSRNAQKISAIAYDAGFNSLSAFNDIFKKKTGCTPSQYRLFGRKDHKAAQ